jgi:hypothetical protein
MPQQENFRLVTELMSLHRRDWDVADAKILRPLNSRALVQGEWLEVNSAYKLARGGDNDAATADICTNAMVFPVLTEQGRTDVQAIRKPNVAMFGHYEAETLLINPTGLGVGDPLSVADVNFGGIVRRALVKATMATNTILVGYVSKLPSPGGAGWVRFVHYANEKMK